MKRLLVSVVLFLLLPSAADATYSIVARNPDTGELGVAVQSRAFNVGMSVPWARAGVGAIATQANTNDSFGPRGLALLAEGLPAAAVLDRLLTDDPNPESRQLAVLDAAGRSAQHTGATNGAWAGGRQGDDYACQGNLLAGEAVVDAMAEAFESTDGELSARLVAALVAAQEAGGDRRGMQSAALLVVRPSERWPEYRERYVDLRVDDHPDPIAEIQRIYRMLEGTDLARARIRLAAEYRDAGDAAAADREVRAVSDILGRALEFEGTAPGTLNAVAWYLCTHGVELERCLDAARRAVDAAPEETAYLDTLAEVYFRLGRYERAEEVGARAVALAPEDPYLTAQLERFRARRTDLEPGQPVE